MVDKFGNESTTINTDYTNLQNGYVIDTIIPDPKPTISGNGFTTEALVRNPTLNITKESGSTIEVYDASLIKTIILTSRSNLKDYYSDCTSVVTQSVFNSLVNNESLDLEIESVIVKFEDFPITINENTSIKIGTTQITRKANISTQFNINASSISYKSNQPYGIKKLYIKSIDAAGNSNVSDTLTFNIIDTTKPIYTIIGDDTIYHQATTTYIDQGATARLHNGTTLSVVSTSTVNINALGRYTVTYSVTGKTGTQVRNVIVINKLPPTITINESYNTEHEINTPFTNPNVTAADVFGNAVSVKTKGFVNTTSVGLYTVTFEAESSESNENQIKHKATKDIVINVKRIRPELIITGEEIIKHPVGTTYNDQGATAKDVNNNSLPITVVNPVNYKKPGLYSIIYTAVDNTITVPEYKQVQKTRTVIIFDNQEPKINYLIGGPNIVHELNTPYFEKGMNITEFSDCKIIDTNGAVKPNCIGKYDLTYTVRDNAPIILNKSDFENEWSLTLYNGNTIDSEKFNKTIPLLTNSTFVVDPDSSNSTTVSLDSNGKITGLSETGVTITRNIEYPASSRNIFKLKIYNNKKTIALKHSSVPNRFDAVPERLKLYVSDTEQNMCTSYKMTKSNILNKWEDHLIYRLCTGLNNSIIPTSLSNLTNVFLHNTHENMTVSFNINRSDFVSKWCPNIQNLAIPLSGTTNFIFNHINHGNFSITVYETESDMNQNSNGVSLNTNRINLNGKYIRVNDTNTSSTNFKYFKINNPNDGWMNKFYLEHNWYDVKKFAKNKYESDIPTVINSSSTVDIYNNHDDMTISYKFTKSSFITKWNDTRLFCKAVNNSMVPSQLIDSSNHEFKIIVYDSLNDLLKDEFDHNLGTILTQPITINKTEINSATKQILINKGLSFESRSSPANIDYSKPSHFFDTEWKIFNNGNWPDGTNKTITALAWSTTPNVIPVDDNSDDNPYTLRLRGKFQINLNNKYIALCDPGIKENNKYYKWYYFILRRRNDGVMNKTFFIENWENIRKYCTAQHGSNVPTELLNEYGTNNLMDNDLINSRFKDFTVKYYTSYSNILASGSTLGSSDANLDGKYIAINDPLIDRGTDRWFYFRFQIPKTRLYGSTIGDSEQLINNKFMIVDDQTLRQVTINTNNQIDPTIFYNYSNCFPTTVLNLTQKELHDKDQEWFKSKFRIISGHSWYNIFGNNNNETKLSNTTMFKICMYQITDIANTNLLNNSHLQCYQYLMFDHNSQTNIQLESSYEMYVNSSSTFRNNAGKISSTLTITNKTIIEAPKGSGNNFVINYHDNGLFYLGMENNYTKLETSLIDLNSKYIVLQKDSTKWYYLFLKNTNDGVMTKLELTNNWDTIKIILHCH